MKKSDIKINGEYAYSRHNYGSMQRVRVLGEAKIKQGWGYGAKTITGSKVQVLDSRTGEPAVRKNATTGEEVPWIFDCANREIREDWAPYAERMAAQAKARKANADYQAEQRDARARVLLDLIPALREAGFEDTEDSWIRDTKVVDALNMHVEDCIVVRPDRYGREGETETVLVAPLARDLVEYVANGSAIPVPGPTLLRILQVGHIR